MVLLSGLLLCICGLRPSLIGVPDVQQALPPSMPAQLLQSASFQLPARLAGGCGGTFLECKQRPTYYVTILEEVLLNEGGPFQPSLRWWVSSQRLLGVNGTPLK